VSGFLLRILINAIIICVLVAQLPGIFVDTLGGTLWARPSSIANAAIRPMLTLAAMPFNIVTVGSVAFFTNLLTPLAVVKTLPGFQISSFLAPLAGILLMTLCSYTLTKVIQDR
jgi:putative membrane protein